VEGGSDTHQALDDNDGFRKGLNPSCALRASGQNADVLKRFNEFA
jgi:hypothetical protein